MQAVVDRVSIRNKLLQAGEAEDGSRYYNWDEPEVYKRVLAILETAEQTLIVSPKPGEQLHDDCCFVHLIENRSFESSYPFSFKLKAAIILIIIKQATAATTLRLFLKPPN